MGSYNICGGRALRIVIGILALVIIMTAYTGVVSATPTPTATPTNLIVDAKKDLPGLDTGIDVNEGSIITINAQGQALFGTGSANDCSTSELTNPDGQRIANDTICAPKMDSLAVLPSSPVGRLIGSIAPLGSFPTTWFATGSNYSAPASATGRLFLLYNDVSGQYGNNNGNYQVTVAISTPTPTETTPTPQSICIQSFQPITSTTTMSRQYYIDATVYNPDQNPQSASFLVSESGSVGDYGDSPIASQRVTISSLAGKTSKTFTVGPFSHTWRWLRPIEKQGGKGLFERFFVEELKMQLIDLIPDAGTADLKKILDFAKIALPLGQFLEDNGLALSWIQYTYTYHDLQPCSSQIPQQTEVIVKVPDYKVDMFRNSWVTDLVAGEFTTWGIKAGLSGNALLSLALLDSQVIWKDLAIVWLQGAFDPDSNYTQIVQATPVSLPLSQSYTGQYAVAFDHLGNAISTAKAATIALAKSDGAAQDGNTEWKITQLRSSRDFLTQTEYELTAFLAAADWYKAQQEYIATPGARDQVTNYLRQNGLPSSEIDGLTKLGYTSEDINNTLNNQLAMMPAFQGKYAAADPSIDLLALIADMVNNTNSELSNASPNMDTIPPTSKIAVQGASGKNIEVTINANDNLGGTGIKIIEYSLDNGQTWKTYSSPFTISNDSISAILSRASDNEGNIEFPPQKQTIPTATLQVRFTTNKDIYSQGEQVIFTLINNGTDVIDLPNSAPWWVENATTGEKIFSPIAAQVITPLDPGQSASWTWDQSNSEGQQVPSGTYQGVIKTSIGNSSTQDFEITLSSALRGDVNKNGKLDTGDATLILRSIVGLPIPSQYQPILSVGDMNCNNRIDTGDATLVLRDVVGLPIPRCSMSLS